MSSTMGMAVATTEILVTTTISLVVLYMTVLVYKYSPSAIVGVNVLVGAVIAVIHHYMVTLETPLIIPGSSLTGAVDELLVIMGVGLVSMIISFIIAMKRFTFLESLGIFVAGGVASMILNFIFMSVFRTTPPRQPQQKQQRQ
jgi:hypothetical protein